MLDILKNSKGDILKLFFRDPDQEYYLREIGKELGQEPGSFQSAIEYLIKEEILKDERRANLRYFKLNKDHPLYEEFKKIISKTVGLEARLKELVNDLSGINHAFIFGSIAKDKEYGGSDIDLMLIGEVDQDKLINKINQVEEELKREINYHIYSDQEVIKKLKGENDFLTNVFDQAKILLKGNIDELRKIA